LDSIAEFLKSPAWKNPILEFIDDNCIVFDEEDENKLEYTDIHNVLLHSYSLFRDSKNWWTTS